MPVHKGNFVKNRKPRRGTAVDFVVEERQESVKANKAYKLELLKKANRRN